MRLNQTGVAGAGVKRHSKITGRLGWVISVLFLAESAQAQGVRVTISNLAPQNGSLLTPFWVGFHDGTFDLYDRGSAASPALERLAEDGMTGPLSAAFGAQSPSGLDATVVAGGGFPPFAPGAVASMDFSLDPLNAGTRYFSFASMLIPSNDAFIANGNPMAFPIFGPAGEFLGADILILGSMVLDAGTEVNDELPSNTAFFGQAAPDTGVSEGGVVEFHPGFKPVGSGGILDGSFAGFSFGNADFLAADYAVARITVTPVPEGSTLITGTLMALGCAGWLLRRRSAVLE